MRVNEIEALDLTSVNAGAKILIETFLLWNTATNARHAHGSAALRPLSDARSCESGDSAGRMPSRDENGVQGGAAASEQSLPLAVEGVPSE